MSNEEVKYWLFSFTVHHKTLHVRGHFSIGSLLVSACATVAGHKTMHRRSFSKHQ
jgi:hypothetical protein